MTNFNQIGSQITAVNETEETKVNSLIISIRKNGYIGAPILFCEAGLITGSHRYAALTKISEMLDKDFDANEDLLKVLETPCFYDVSEFVENYCEKEEMSFDEIDFQTLSLIFEDTEIEKWSAEIEW